jgi:ABC-type transport system involved in multi-copper enzyme maturation permease subunit
MSQAGVVTRLAVRELWISFRLLALLAAYVGVGAIVALLPAPPGTTLIRFSVGLAAAMIVGCAITADALSTERALGRTGWLVTRSISRATLLVGWFAAVAGVTLLGLGAAGLLGWLAIASPIAPVTPLAFAVVLGGVAAMCLAFVAVGLLIGSMLRPFFSAAAAMVVGVVAVTVGVSVAPGSVLPLAALADLVVLNRPIGDGIQGAGTFLAATGAALVAARLALGRVDL